MLSRLRKHFTYANVALTVALVLAMSGGAYAAGKYLITSTKQINPKVLKQLIGKTGATGAAGATGAVGAAGSQGPAGLAGIPGAQGVPGVKGENGAEGKPGTSVTSKTVAEGSKDCSAGGTEFKAGTTTTYACNGSPWVAGGTLPSGKSEYGVWGTSYTATSGGQDGMASISFTIPLGETPEAYEIGINEEYAGGKNEAAAIKEGKCSGTVGQPEAAPGVLCIFSRYERNLSGNPGNTVVVPLALTQGALITTNSEEEGEVRAAGTWAVTGG